MESIHELLVAGRNELVSRGWGCNWYDRATGTTCLVGSLGIARGYSVVALPGLGDPGGDRLIWEACQAMGFSSPAVAVAWSDINVLLGSPLTTVLELYDAAIAATAPVSEISLPEIELESERELVGV